MLDTIISKVIKQAIDLPMSAFMAVMFCVGNFPYFRGFLAVILAKREKGNLY